MKASKAALICCIAISCGYLASSQVSGQSSLVGRRVKAPVLMDEQGRDIRIEYGKRPTVLFIVSNGCEWCERNAHSVAALAARLESKFRFIGVSLGPSGIPTFTKLVRFPVYAARNLKDEQWQEYALGITPSLMVVSPDSRILQVWNGAIRNINKASIEKYFGVALPELTVKP
jgi:hypothetical protein